MKKLYIIPFFCLFFSAATFAQPYGNEWINFSTNQPYSNQQYFKVNVWRDGLYRITYSDLQAALFPMPFNPKHLQLFYMGQEQYIHVEGEADASFDPNDYIEFYGKRNDGTFDARLYKQPDHQLNNSYSLYTDTASYFLTINTNPFAVNKRTGFETDVNFLGYTPLPYYMAEAKRSFANVYHQSEIVLLQDSEFSEGAGWMRSHIATQTPENLPVPNFSQDPTAPLARVSTSTMGGNSTGNNHTISISVHGTTQTNSFFGFGISRFDFPLLSNSSITGSTATFVFEPGAGVVNKTHISFIKMIYPHTFSFSGETSNFRRLLIPGNLAPGKSYLSFTNMNMVNPRLYMISGDTLKRVSLAGSGNSWQALVPTFGDDKHCFVVDTIYTVASGHMKIVPINQDPARFAKFINYLYNPNANYLIVSHKNLWNKANDYKNYRSLTGYTPLLADIDELYDQFAYGIVKHPLSIRNFCKFTLDTFSLKPEYLLLIGKSVNMRLTRPGASTIAQATVAANWNTSIVPSFGTPPSDMLFAAGFNDTIPRMSLAVGRIPATVESEVQAYLDKIIVHEAQLQQCPQEWMKRILHFGGGSSLSESLYMESILKGFENIASDTLWGATAITFLKNNTDPIQVNLSQYLQALIDSGTSMMTFVGHGSGSTFDISTDLPQNYNNKDRYPLVLANSCNVGDIHTPTRQIVEDFVLLPEKGSIAFVAQPTIGYLGNLQVYSNHFYRQTALINYGGTVGKTMMNIVDSIFSDPAFTNSYFTYYFYKSICTGMALSGDPALVMHSFDKADYEIKTSSISFTPDVITSELDSFEVNVIIKNLGKAVNTPFVLHMSRQFPDGGANFELDTLLNYIPYKDTITIKLGLNAVRSVGPNLFSFHVDYFNAITECNETNNIAVNIPLLIQSSDIVPVYPAEFAIVPNNSVSIKASVVNPFSPIMPYKFQIDTTDSFSSPFMQQTIISSPGGVVQWPLPFTLQQDLVYYWRVSRDSMAGDTIHPNWKESSFIHKQNLTGWSQAHHSQFKKDDYVNVIYQNIVNPTFTFVQTASSLLIRNYKNPIASVQDPLIEMNQVVQDYGFCFTTPSIHVFVIDSVSLKLWETDVHVYGQTNYFNTSANPPAWTCRQRPEKYFVFRDTATQRAAMLAMLQNSVPDGNYVGFYSVFSVQYSQWDPALVNLVQSWGGTALQQLADGDPYIFFTKKGDNSQTQESVGDSVNTNITLSASLGGNWKKGFIKSVAIGPAEQWTSLHWDQFPLETTGGADSVAIDILGVMPNGVEVPIPGFTGIQVGNYDVNISTIDATIYPRLKLQAYLQDEVLFTPPQLKRWQIYYDEIPELALNPAKYFKLNKDTLAEGDMLSMEMAIENIGNVKSDSVLVDFYLFDHNRVRHNLTSPKYKETFPGDTIIASVSFSTGGYPGLNSLWIEANPRQDQPEQYHFNNIAEIKFQVDRDLTNPILDVTFDGMYIMNGDLVSGKPEIQIKLKDENKFLALNDTSNWQVFLRMPNGVQQKLYFEPVPCSGVAVENMKWCPANLPNNTFKIEFKPILMEDGIYELWVQASDMSGNISGDNNYRITFEVINKSTITEVINYPNPFSTSTRFVFTLTGSEIPEYFKIQIMTVTGKIVREITHHELGPIRIGRNITQYAWNGKDEFGDQLANGVYLYRVITRLHGAGIEKRETPADKFFTKGWGKMYLMR